MKNKLTDKQVKRINEAFERVSVAVDKYLDTCWKNGAPVRSITVHGSREGGHVGSRVRYFGISS